MKMAKKNIITAAKVGVFLRYVNVARKFKILKCSKQTLSPFHQQSTLEGVTDGGLAEN
jgi:hypothetical protein